MVGTQPNIQLMSSQCGIFTNAGSSDQIDGAPLYDGTQNDWVAEKINLEEFLGEEEVYIGFRFISDGFVEGDGFYFDDLELEVILDIDTGIDDFEFNNHISIEPNPTADNFKVVLGEELTQINSVDYQLIDITGKIVQTGILNGSNIIDINQMPNGIYQLILMEGERRLATKKVIKI